MSSMEILAKTKSYVATRSGRDVFTGVSCLLLVHDEFEQEGLCGLLTNRGMRSIETSSNFELATETVARFKPGVIIVVAGDPPDCPADVIAQIGEVAPDSGLIVLCAPSLVGAYLPVVSSMPDRVTSARLLLRATLRDGDRIMTAVDQVVNGYQTVDSDVIDVLVRGQFKRSVSLARSLTKREFQVFELVCSGAANIHIARRLGMSPPYVGNILTRIFAKLGLREDPNFNRRVLACREFMLEFGSCDVVRSNPISSAGADIAA